MPNLIITRPSEWSSRMRDYQIYVDGNEIGAIANDESKYFTVPAGIHTIKAQIDWCGSKEQVLDIVEGEVKEVKIAGFKYGKRMPELNLTMLVLFFVLRLFFDIPAGILLVLVLPMFLYLLYLMTIGRNNFLQLEVLP